jgi:ABC-type sugar transport system ATPase subunit
MNTSQANLSAAPPEPGGAAPLLEVRDLVKDFPGMRALDGVSLDVRRGEIHALLGENGAGKSTLIKCVVGAHPPTEGIIFVDGNPVSFHNPHDAQAAGISVVHQHANLVPTLTVQENLNLGRALPRRGGLFVDWRSTRKDAVELFRRVNMDIDPRSYVSTLRPDQAAMVAIAKAIASDAKLIVLDEPTASLSPTEADVLFGHMRNLASEGHGFLYVSHRLSEVFEIADRISVIRDGKYVGTWERENVVRREIIAAIIGSDTKFSDKAAVAVKHGAVSLSVKEVSGNRVNSATFDLHNNEILGIAGLPGSGAEEMLDLLFGRDKIISGNVVLANKVLNLSSPRAAIQAGLALVPKDRHGEANLPGFSVRENIAVASLGKHLSDPVFRFIRKRAERRTARDVVVKLNVKTPDVETEIDALSGGNQQKTILGRWLSTDASVFLLNSPTAAVDVGAKVEIYDLIAELTEQGAAVIFTTTEIEEFPRLCHRVIVFHSGRIVGELTGEQVSETNIMALAAGG